MSVSPRIVDGHIWWSCRYPHEDCRREHGNNRENNSFTLTKRDDSHDLHVKKGSLFRKYSFMILLTFQLRIVSTLPDKGISEGGQFVYSSEFWEIDKGWRTSQPQNTHRTQGFLIYMVHDVSAHKRKGCSLLECFKGISCTHSPRRNIPCDVCEKTTYSRTKTTNGVRLEPLVVECCCDSWTLKRCHGLESQKKTFGYDGENATKIKSALADTSIQFSRPVTSTLVKTLCVYLILVTSSLTVCHRLFSPSVVYMSSSMGTWRMNTWYTELTDKEDDPHSSFSIRVSDTIVETNRSSYQIQETIAKDEERLAMEKMICSHKLVSFYVFELFWKKWA